MDIQQLAKLHKPAPRQPSLPSANKASKANHERRKKLIDDECKRQQWSMERERTVGMELYKQFIRSNRKVRDRYAYRVALHYLIVERDYTDKYGNILIPDYKIAVWCVRERGISQYYNNNFNAETFLREFRRDVLPQLQWSDYGYARHLIDVDDDGRPTYGEEDQALGRCRMVLNDGLAEVIEREQNDFNYSLDRYLLVNGTQWNRANARKREKALQEKSQSIQWPYRQQREIADYLHTLPLSLFTKTIPGKIEDARNVLTAGTGEENQDAKDTRQQLRQLRSIADFPKPYYAPGQSGYNARLFASNSLCTIDRRARRVLCAGWHETDLTACYPAIAAAIFPIPRVQEMLINGVDVWYQIAQELELEESYTESKDVIKCIGARLLCGGRIDKTNEELHKEVKRLHPHMSNENIKAQFDILHSPTLLSLIDAVDQQKKRIRQEHQTLTPLGLVKLPVKEDGRFNTSAQTVRSHLANILSAYELALLYPCFELAKQSTDFTITIMQHDGFSVKLRRESQADQILNRLNAVVADVANQYDIQTRLTYKT